MLVEIKVPAVGESVNEGVILTWFKQNGEQVQVDDPLYELETDKITLEVLSEVSGVLTIKQPAGSEVEVGDVVALIDDAATATAPAVAAVAVAPAAVAPAAVAPAAPAAASANANHAPISPAARHLALQHNVDLSQTKGSGKGGLILKEDVQQAVSAPPPAPKAAPVSIPAARPTQPYTPVIADGGGQGPRQTRSKMTPIRKRIAQRLVQAQQEAAILTTFNEVDMSGVMALRSKYQDEFVKKYGIKLGFMSFFVKAVVNALQEVPGLNSYIEGEEIVQNHFYDVGIAVGTDRGLVVPVVRNADQLGFAQVEQEIAALANKARTKKLTLDDLTGGSFSITNGGIYGSLLSTPILNSPQSGILGMHGIKRRPIAVGDAIEIRPMMYLALSYDHRLVDGKEAVTFLKRIVECIETPDRLLFGV